MNSHRRIVSVCSLVLLGLAGPLACSDDGDLSSTSDDTETSTTGDGDGDSDSDSDSVSGDGDGDPATATDTDPSDSGDGDGDPTDSGDGDGDPTDTDPTDSGDGDGDMSGDGDGDMSGDGDGDMSGDGDGDGDMSGDGDGDMGPPDPDGSSPANAGLSCNQINLDGFADGDGLYWIDPDGPMMGEEPFEVDCDMSTDGGGWTRLRLEDSDNLIVAEYDVDNPWNKCEDDSAQHFAWLIEDDVTPDISPLDFSDTVFDLEYANPGNDTLHTPAQLDAIRASISELNAATRMVGLTSDDDNGNYQNDMNGGHEVYIVDTNNVEHLLTSGEDGDCGGGNGSWPSPGTESGYYLYNHDDADSIVDGVTAGVDSDALLGLPPEALIPVQVRIVIDTGGGAAFGYEQQVFLVR